MTSSPWQEWKKRNAERQSTGRVSPAAFINPDTEYADEATAKERMDMCLECEYLIDLTKQCRKCGCFMNLKTKLAYAECPIGKWVAVDVN